MKAIGHSLYNNLQCSEGEKQNYWCTEQATDIEQMGTNSRC